jgi:hypothetical protein
MTRNILVGSRELYMSKRSTERQIAEQTNAIVGSGASI